MPTSPAAHLTAASLLAASGCDFALLTLLAPTPRGTDLEALTQEASFWRALPTATTPAGGLALLWPDADVLPTTAELVEAAGYWEATGRNLKLTEASLLVGDQPLSLASALVLWQSLSSHWAALLKAGLSPDWFAEDGLVRCGRCTTCTRAMQEADDLGLLSRIGVKNRKQASQELGVYTVAELARVQGSVPQRWVLALGEAARREGLDRPEIALLQEAESEGRPDRAGDLQELARERTLELLAEEELPLEVEPPSAAEQALALFLEGLPEDQELGAKEQAIAMVASATGYHRRERTEFWREHFARVYGAPEGWELGSSVGLVEGAEVVEDWAVDPERPRALPTRVLELALRTGEGFSLRVGEKSLALFYASGRGELPDHLRSKAGDLVLDFEQKKGVLPACVNVAEFRAEVLAVESVPGSARVRIREGRGRDAGDFVNLPCGLGPSQPIPTRAHEEALVALAERVGASLPDLPVGPALDLAARRPPRLLDGGVLARPENFGQDELGRAPLALALCDSLRRLDSSYLAVQGPPGAGKTFIGSQVLATLLAEGWKVGVVAQSHAVVENMLSACITKGGVDPSLVAKFKGKSQREDFPWREVTEKELPAFLAGPAALVGGTAWDFASAKKFADAGLDLLVIDEAGQYSLANTFAVSRAARNLLLLGDPQQLPQVTQGVHPHHVEESALGWLMGGAALLDPAFGYFMETSWRMHPALCAPVSALSYGGALSAAPAAAQRCLSGWEPGLYLRRVQHSFNAVSSPEEAAAVVEVARDFLGSSWQEGGVTRPLQQQDILVVAAYNAQVDAIRAACQDAGLEGIKVGTVDKFQGQEAPLVLVSMAASSPADSARAADFLLSAHRLNVALSRGQWCAVLLTSEHFTRYLPQSLPELESLAAFIKLLGQAHPLPGKRG